MESDLVKLWKKERLKLGFLIYLFLKNNARTTLSHNYFVAYYDWLLSLSHRPTIFFTTYNLPHRTIVLVTKCMWKCVVLTFSVFKTMRLKSEKVTVEEVCLQGNGLLVLLDLLGWFLVFRRNCGIKGWAYYCNIAQQLGVTSLFSIFW